MTLGKRIAQRRRQLGLTQEGLAQRLDVTNQAVSKWESDQCCPDITQLPKLADLFGITLDELFGREIPTPEAEPVEEPAEEPVYEQIPEEEPWKKSRGLIEKLLRTTFDKVNQAVEQAEQKVKQSDVEFHATPRVVPIPVEVTPDWEDDDTLRVVIFQGKRMVEHHPVRKEILFRYEGPALNVHSECDLTCGYVEGNASAKGDMTCGSVSGSVTADGDTTCDNVSGNVTAGGDVDCGSVLGHVKAGGDVDCESVHGNVTAGGDVDCTSVLGSAKAGGDVNIG